MFTHLRTKTCYSLLNSTIRPKALIDQCKAFNMPAVGVMDSNNLSCMLEISEYAAMHGIQFIPAIELDLQLQQDKNLKMRVPLLAQTQLGYQNIVKLCSAAYRNNNIPCLSIQDLKRHSQDVLILTGLQSNGWFTLCNKHGYFDEINAIRSIFQNRIFVELIRPHQNQKWEGTLFEFASEHLLPVVATNNALFLMQNDFRTHDIALCIANGKYLVQHDRPKSNPEWYFKDTKEMELLFHDIPQALENSNRVAQKCSFMPKSRELSLPHFPCAQNEEQELKQKAHQGLLQCVENPNEEYIERLEYELDVITKMKYSGYFLIVADFIQWSKKHDIPVGPGRGSGAGSVVAWSLGITDIDPLKFDLLFERFLNPDRISMPDFDIDFCQEKRDIVINYVAEKYGRDRIAHISTFGNLKPRAVIRDVGRVLQFPYSQVDRICKMIPNNPVKPVTLQEAIDLDTNLQNEQNNDEEVHRLLEAGLELEGLPRHASTHAAGIVISPSQLEDFIPIYFDHEKASMPITQFDMKFTEKAGLIKFDFLGLKTLTLIQCTCVAIKKNHNAEIDINALPLDDTSTYDMLSTGNTTGVFQLEGSGMQDVLKQLKADRFEDIIALISLYRPGPMANIPTYIQCKHGIQEPDYMDPAFKNLLGETYGVIIYQEQVMKIAQIMAGYSLSEADLLRRAMGKKIQSEMDKQKEVFISGAIANGFTAEKSKYIFDLVSKFAGYGFNKSHATGYGMISYQTAYLKTHYPIEFFIESMNLDIHNSDKLNLFLYDAMGHNIKILPPDVNRSEVLFLKEDNAIQYALLGIKGVSEEAAKEIVQCRHTSCFVSVNDFLTRINLKIVNKKSLDNLVLSGAFDALHQNRKQLYNSIEHLIKAHSKTTSDNQLLLFKEISHNTSILSNVNDWDYDGKLTQEFNVLGLYLTDHPINKYRFMLQICNIGTIQDIQDGKNTRIAVVITNIKIRSSSYGKFATLKISDEMNIIDVGMYNSASVDKYEPIMNNGEMIIAEISRLQNKNGDGYRIVCKSMRLITQFLQNSEKSIHISISNHINLSNLKAKLRMHDNGLTTLISINNSQVRLSKRYIFSQEIVTEIKKINGVLSITSK